MCAVAFGDGEREFAFSVVAVADMDDVPGVDNGDRVEVGRADVSAVVVGFGGELVEVVAQPPGTAFLADGTEGDRVGAGLGEEVAAEAERVPTGAGSAPRTGAGRRAARRFRSCGGDAG